MSLLRDLADDRRMAKPWLPAEATDASNGLVVPDSIEWDGRPMCVLHGAMAQVAPAEDDEARIHRCQEQRCGVGAIWYPTNSRVSKRTVSEAWDAKFLAGQKEGK